MSKLYFRYAAMNAGKSTHLLQAAYNYEERGMRVRLFTAALDDRSGVGLIGSRLGLTRQVETFGPDTVFDSAWVGDGVACLLIDETLPPRTALLEAVYVLECIADAKLNIARFLPPTPPARAAWRQSW